MVYLKAITLIVFIFTIGAALLVFTTRVLLVYYLFLPLLKSIGRKLKQFYVTLRAE
jgi:hypothetical protein